MLDIVLSVAMLGLIFGMTIPMYKNFSIRNDLDIATNGTVQALRRAQTLSQVADGDTSWGVHVSSGSILIYKGTSYALRDTTYDEVTAIPTSITLSGLLDVTLTKVSGLPQSTGTFILTSATQETRNVTINQKGMVDY
jgi:hypothetical protein